MKKTILSTLLLASAIGVQAQYPIIQTKYTADPAPYVHGDTIYLYTTHDEDDAEGFKMYDWLLYTSTDRLTGRIMVLWLLSRISSGTTRRTAHGQNVLLNATANGICIALSTVMALECS